MAVQSCPCPLDATIGDLLDQECEQKIGQIGKIGFQLLGQEFVSIGELAEWTSALNATDPTKVQVTTTLHSQETTPAEPITIGSAGSNDVFDGTIKVIGEGFYQITFNLRNPSPEVLKALKAYECESNRTGIYLMGTEFIISTADSSAIPFTNFFVQSSPSLNGNADDNLAQLQITLPSDWYENSLITTKPDLQFNPMTLLNG